MANTDNTKPGEISAEELERVSGGVLPWGLSDKTTEVFLRDSRGNPTHWRMKCRGAWVSEPFHYICPNCSRLLHQGSLGRMYCDPCDESWFPSSVRNSSYQRDGIYSGR